MSYFTRTSAPPVIADVEQERLRQNAKWGEQNHPDGTGPDIRLLDGGRWSSEHVAGVFRHRRRYAAEHGVVTWQHILAGDVFEAFAETDPAKLRAELIQVAAVAVQWVEAIDRRGGAE